MLGLLLKDVRMMKHIRSKALVDGTSCTTTMLKKYEKGMTQFEKLLGDALWQHTGKSTETYIQKAIRKGELAEAEEALDAYEKLEKTDRVQHRQFICLLKRVIFKRFLPWFCEHKSGELLFAGGQW